MAARDLGAPEQEQDEAGDCQLEEAAASWTVPWGGGTIFQVMVLWWVAFWLCGSWLLPGVMQALRFDAAALSVREQAFYSLVTDVTELLVSLAVLRRCLRQFAPLPPGWFPATWRGLWFVEPLAACALFPVVHHLSRLNLRVVAPVDVVAAGARIEQSLMARDPWALLLYVLVVSVCAPIWEEVVFRGFLLPSLTRYLPVWLAVAASALAFAAVHVSPQRLLPLTFLGLILGTVFVRSRNLLASMLVHSLWNCWVLVELLRS